MVPMAYLCFVLHSRKEFITICACQRNKYQKLVGQDEFLLYSVKLTCVPLMKSSAVMFVRKSLLYIDFVLSC